MLQKTPPTSTAVLIDGGSSSEKSVMLQVPAHVYVANAAAAINSRNNAANNAGNRRKKGRPKKWRRSPASLKTTTTSDNFTETENGSHAVVSSSSCSCHVSSSSSSCPTSSCSSCHHGVSCSNCSVQELQSVVVAVGGSCSPLATVRRPQSSLSLDHRIMRRVTSSIRNTHTHIGSLKGTSRIVYRVNIFCDVCSHRASREHCLLGVSLSLPNYCTNKYSDRSREV